MHLATTISATAGPAVYDGVLGTLRRVYRPTLVVEILLIAVPALVHVACAVAQIRMRRCETRASVAPARLRAHRIAGYVLLAALGGHVFATRIMPSFGSGPADFSYLAYSLLNWPLFMWPYYVTLGAAGALHLGLGVGIAVRVLFGVRLAMRPAIAAAVVMAALVATGALAMIANAPEASPARFAEFRALYERFMPFLPPRF